MATSDLSGNRGSLALTQESHSLSFSVDDLASERNYAVAGKSRSIHALFAAQARRTPDRVALSGDGRKVSYRELHVEAEALAHRLREQGVGSGALVAIYAARSSALIVALLATLQTGAAYVGLDLESPPARLAEILGEVRPAAILTQRALAARLPSAAVSETRVICLDDDALPSPKSSGSATSNDDAVNAETLAYVSFTSGTTGRPKGVCIPQRGVVRLVQAPDYVEITPDDVFLQFAPLAFDASTFEIWGALLNGARLAIYPEQKPSLPELARFIEREQVSILWLTAGLFHQLVEAELLSHLRGVRQLLAGGDVLSVPHVGKALRALPATRLINGYGPTENSTFTCCHTIGALPPEEQSIPIGKPINGTTCHVLDEEQRALPDGEVGELYVGGTGLATGYLQQPQLTAEKFVPDPFSADPAARLYRTGDRVRWLPGGDLEFLGRTDRQVKIRGYRVELDEIEAVFNQCPSLLAAAVAVQRGTAGEERLVAGVVAKPAVTAAEVRAWAQVRLASYMIPSRIIFLASLPLNRSGKVDREALLALATAAPVATAIDDPPRDSMEAAVAAIWREILGLSHVERAENFFECGGDSLRASHLLVRIQTVLGKSVPVDVLLEKPTVAELASFLDTQPVAAPPAAAVQILRPGGKDQAPLFFVPSQGGDLMCYAAVARHLDLGGRPLLGLQESVLFSDRPVEAETSIEAVAAAHVRTLRECQPAGPYHLIGFCFGGLVAFEMARQLRADGLSVGWLGVLDYRFEPTGGRRAKFRRTARAPWAFARNLGYALHDLLTLPADERRALQQRAVSWFRRGPGVAGTKACGVPLQGITADLSHYTDRQLQLLAIHELAWQRYAPATAPVPLPITVFRPRRLPLWRTWDTMLGWERVASTASLRVRIVPGPGAHGALLKEPFARVLAREIERSLQRDGV